MLESMNKKTLIIIGSSILGLLILLLVGAWLISIFKPHYYTYEEAEGKILEATTAYYKANPTLLPTVDGDYTLLYSALVTGEYIKPLNEILKDGDSCTAEIVVSKYGENYSYIPYLTCPGSYETKELYKVVESNNPVVESGKGLYQKEDGSSYFRGEVTNNYVVLDTKTDKKDTVNMVWRIVSIEADKTMKLVSTDSTKKINKWDDRYNESVDKTYGYNDFELSRIKDQLNELASGNNLFSDTAKSKLVAKTWCIGKINASSSNNTGTAECATMTQDKMLIGLLSAYEVAQASIDSNCVTPFSNSCRNYNYLATTIKNSNWLITGLTSDSYSVLFFDGATVKTTFAKSKNVLYPVVYLSKRAFFASGSGTITDPYILK